MQEHVTTNQTHFAAEEPLLDQPQAPRAYQPGGVEEPATGPWWKNRNLVLGGVLVGLLLLILTVVILFTSNGENPMIEVQPSPSPVTRQSSEYQQRLKGLQDDLQKADPTQKELPFPPVSEEIRL